jgi:hypothetical protein
MTTEVVPKRGDIVERDGVRYVVVDVMPRLTPFRKKNQDTTVEGYTLGLARAVHCDRCYGFGFKPVGRGEKRCTKCNGSGYMAKRYD